MGICGSHNVWGIGCGVKKVWWRTVSARTGAEARLVRVMGEWLDGGKAMDVFTFEVDYVIV